VSSGDQSENSPDINDQRDGPHASNKDGMIELCFQLLSSGRRLDEILTELAANSSMRDDGHSEPEGTTNPKTAPLPAAEAEPLMAIAAAEFARSMADGAMRQPSAVAPEPADREETVGRGHGRLDDGRFAHRRLPVVDSGRTQRDRAIDRRPVEANGGVAPRRRALARRIGTMLVCTSAVTAIPGVTHRPLPAEHDRPARQPQAVAGEQPSAARGGAQDPAGAVTAARNSAPLPRPPIAAALIPLPVEPGAAASINSQTGPSITAGNLPVRPAMLREAASGVRIKAAELRVSDGAVEALVTRGDALLATGDIASARLVYQRGADAGNGTAALRLGEMFDPAFLAQAGLSRAPGDVKKAAYWYRRARDLGVRRAELLLKGIAPAKPAAPPTRQDIAPAAASRIGQSGANASRAR
jgi:hypothetical protein